MKKTYIVLIGFCFLTILFSCTADFEKINTPPTSASVINPGLLLAKVQKDGNFMQGTEFANCVVGSWIQQWNSSLILPQSRYIFQNGNWAGNYSCIRNISQIRNDLLLGKENDPEGRTRLAIAKIVEIDLWQDLTDMFGDIPFSETALGNDNVIRQPKYDTQESIYVQLLLDIDEAMNKLTSSDKSYGNEDLYYKGDVDKWRKYANSIKLRLGMYLKNRLPELSKSTVLAALMQPLLESNDDNAKINTFNDVLPSYHPVLSQVAIGSPDLRYLADAFVSHLVKTNDPRLDKIASPSVNSIKAGKPEYKGKKVALTDDEMIGIINDDYSMPSPETYFNLKKSIPYYVYTYAEICFYKAEIALEGWSFTIEQAEEFYQEGIRASMVLEPYNITAIPQAYIDTEFSFAGLTKEQKMEKIMTQKWILLFGRSYDAYAEWRRTGYPKLKPGPNKGSTNGQIPRRMSYPSEEEVLNTENYQQVVKTMPEGDSYTSRVWWDKGME